MVYKFIKSPLENSSLEVVLSMSGEGDNWFVRLLKRYSPSLKHEISRLLGEYAVIDTIFFFICRIVMFKITSMMIVGIKPSSVCANP